MVRYSIIMPVYLGEYENCAKDRITKFIRALNSLRKQEYPNEEHEIIIVSHGCFESADIMRKEKKDYLASNFKLVEVPRNCTHEGHTRQAGMEAATGKYIVFVDSDDMLGLNFLAELDKHITLAKDPDFAYYSIEAWGGPASQARVRMKYKLEHTHIGNGNICFKRELLSKGLTYDGLDGYGHDWKFIERIMAVTKDRRDLMVTLPYFVCHIPSYGLDV